MFSRPYTYQAKVRQANVEYLQAHLERTQRRKASGGDSIPPTFSTPRRGQRHTRESFWAMVQRCAHGWDCTECCWPWLGRQPRRKHANYGLIKICVETANGLKSKLESAHRLVLIIINDAGILPGFEALHTCDNPPCCNDHHLFIGTQQDNIRDMELKGRRISRAGEAHVASKLTALEVIELRQLRALGWKYIDLAIRYGVGISAVYAADQHLTWKEVV